MDENQMAEAMFSAVEKYVQRAVEPLLARIAELEGKPEKALPDFQPLVDSMGAQWALDFERRAQGVLERAAERIPKPENGKDGIGFDDLSMEYDGVRGFSVKFQKGEQVKQFDFSLPLVIDAGFREEGKEYQSGDGVTFGGSYWIAQKATTSKPAVGNEDWRLAVKKGRDAKGGA